jgi:hypothetical protein
VDQVHGLRTVQEWLVHQSTGCRPRKNGRSEARRLAAEAREAKGRCGDPSGGLTLGGEVAWWASGGGEQSSVAMLNERGARGEESWGGVVWRGGGGGFLT